MPMLGKLFLNATLITTALLISAGAYAGGGMGGGQGMMGGQGHVMGGGGNDMMGSGQFFSNPWMSQPRKSATDQYKQQEQERLREEIRDRRQELSELYRSDKPDKVLIDQKIAELNELETAYDKSASGGN
jgi:Spy/CpxP family protein refolding chaperone